MDDQNLFRIKIYCYMNDGYVYHIYASIKAIEAEIRLYINMPSSKSGWHKQPKFHTKPQTKVFHKIYWKRIRSNPKQR